jgi:hypothetical protein
VEEKYFSFGDIATAASDGGIGGVFGCVAVTHPANISNARFERLMSIYFSQYEYLPTKQRD